MTTATPTPSNVPRFRGNESAISRFGGYAVHVIGKTPYLYKRQELVGPIDDLPAEVSKLKSVETVLQTARNELKDWGGLQVQETLEVVNAGHTAEDVIRMANATAGKPG